MRPPEVPTEIIGIVGDAKHSQLDQDSEPMSYWPIAELPYTSMTFVLRTRGDTASVANAARTAIQTLDPQQPVADVRTLESLVGSSIARQRFNTLLLAIFAIIALLLSVAGIYGVVSYSVAQRSREIGIRTALGATAQDILRLVLKRGMTLTLFGIGIGLPAAIALTSLIKKLLFGVGSTDVPTFVSVSILLAASALLACYIPARRATRVDPLVALRYE
jgi:putative ABC transport system permease protein